MGKAKSSQKKILIFTLFVFSLFLVSCTGKSSKTTESQISFSSWELESIKIETKYSKDDLKKFQKELENFTWDLSDFSNVVNKARLYSYLGYVWKWILLYDNYFKQKNIEPGFLATNNLAWMYKDICFANTKKYTKYCQKAIELYKELVYTWHKKNYYEDIIWIYYYMDDKETAKKYYKEYLDKWGTKKDYFEKFFLKQSVRKRR